MSGAPMFKPSVKILPIITVLALVLIPSAADAKGGHSHGRAHGASPIRVQSTSQSVKGDPPAPQLSAQATGAAPSTTTGTIPASSLKAVTTLPTPPTVPVPTPASVTGAPAPQVGVIAPLSFPFLYRQPWAAAEVQVSVCRVAAARVCKIASRFGIARRT
jgi:hypothetical protein